MMRWIPILVAACNISMNVLVCKIFSAALCGNNEVQSTSSGSTILNFSKKNSARRHALKTKFFFNSSLLFYKRKFSDKKSVLK